MFELLGNATSTVQIIFRISSYFNVSKNKKQDNYRYCIKVVTIFTRYATGDRVVQVVQVCQRTTLPAVVLDH